MSSNLTPEELRRVAPCSWCDASGDASEARDGSVACLYCEHDGHTLNNAQVEALATLIAEREAAAEKRGREAERDELLSRVEGWTYHDVPESDDSLDADVDDAVVSWRDAVSLQGIAKDIDGELTVLGATWIEVSVPLRAWFQEHDPETLREVEELKNGE